MTESQQVQILDCTIRDGSYVVDYQFTIEDTALVAHGLSIAGMRHIEVGHGLGLNAQNCGKGSAAITDIEYIQAARSSISGNSIVGSFFIPGIGTEDSLRAAVDAGLGFIRLGIDVDDYEKIVPFTRLAKSLGIEVWGNMMKSYIVTPVEFADIARQVGDSGVDVVAIVDSAGGMTPDDVAAYTSATVHKTTVPLAFHGHNNLGMANANCLRFLDEGGLFVDGSLAGLGRSGGNASTEVLAALLTKRGCLKQPLDWERLLEFADAVMSFCVPFHARPKAAEIATGLNYFHSSFAPVVEKAAEQAGAPLFRTILGLPVESRKKVSSEVAQASALAAASQPHQKAYFTSGIESLDRQQPASLKLLAERLSVQKGKSPQKRVISIALSNDITDHRIRPLRSTHDALVAHIEVATETSLIQVCQQLAQSSDLWLIDQKLDISTLPISAQPIYVYDDEALIAQAIVDAIQSVGARRVTLNVGPTTKQKILQRLPRYIEIVDTEPEALIVGGAVDEGNTDYINLVKTNGTVLLLGAGSISAASIAQARHRGLKVRRLDYGPALIAEAERLLGTNQLHAKAGEKEIAPGIRVIAGGSVGQRGDIVVDSLQAPRFILGEADGCGGLSPASKSSAMLVATVQRWIAQSWKL